MKRAGKKDTWEFDCAREAIRNFSDTFSKILPKLRKSFRKRTGFFNFQHFWGQYTSILFQTVPAPHSYESDGCPLTSPYSHHYFTLFSFSCLQNTIVPLRLYNEPQCKTWWNELNLSIYHVVKHCNYHAINYNVLIFCQMLILITFKISKEKKPPSASGNITMFNVTWSKIMVKKKRLVDWLVVLMIYVPLAIFQPRVDIDFEE